MILGFQVDKLPLRPKDSSKTAEKNKWKEGKSF